MNSSVKSDSLLPARLWLLYFLLSIAIVGFLLAYLLCIPLFVLASLFSPLEKAADFIMQKGISFLLALQPWYQGKIQIELPPRLPGQGLLLVSNHRSHLDVFILLSQVRGIKILAKKSLFQIPFLNIMMIASSQIPVPRGQINAFLLAMEEVQRRLQRGQTVHIFPEMTRCSRGFPGVRNFAAAPFLAALRAKVPIVPIAFQGTDETWPKGTWGLFFRRPLRVLSLPSVNPQDFDSVEKLRSEVQKRIDMALR